METRIHVFGLHKNRRPFYGDPVDKRSFHVFGLHTKRSGARTMMPLQSEAAPTQCCVYKAKRNPHNVAALFATFAASFATFAASFATFAASFAAFAASFATFAAFLLPPSSFLLPPSSFLLPSSF